VNRQEGERFSFTLNEIEYDFTVEKISVTDF
jgi:hypothetical protein